MMRVGQLLTPSATAHAEDPTIETVMRYDHGLRSVMAQIPRLENEPPGVVNCESKRTSSSSGKSLLMSPPIHHRLSQSCR